jgi:G2/M phase-specific E3 ubiquitin-protein ligase
MDKCLLCGSSTDNEAMLGTLLKAEGIIVHQFCLVSLNLRLSVREFICFSFKLFAPALFQRGDEDEGIQGFQVADIRKESKRVSAIRCFYCGETRANLGCCVRQCRRAYHTDCALRNRVSFEFAGIFPSYCYDHADYKVPKKIIQDDCAICMEKVGKSRRILIPCCKNSWFHQSCLQKFASTSGVFFKCPLCNDTEICKEKLPLMGIYIPEKDADWEFDFEAYENLNETVEKICDSEDCQSDESFSDFPHLWKLCSTCGASAIHLKCLSDDEFVCRSCDEVLNRTRELPDDEIDNLHGKDDQVDEDESEDEENHPPEQENKEIASDISSDDDSPIKPPKKKPKFKPWCSDEELFDLNASEDDEKPLAKRKSTAKSELNLDKY